MDIIKRRWSPWRYIFKNKSHYNPQQVIFMTPSASSGKSWEKKKTKRIKKSNKLGGESKKFLKKKRNFSIMRNAKQEVTCALINSICALGHQGELLQLNRLLLLNTVDYHFWKGKSSAADEEKRKKKLAWNILDYICCVVVCVPAWERNEGSTSCFFFVFFSSQRNLPSNHVRHKNLEKKKRVWGRKMRERETLLRW